MWNSVECLTKIHYDHVCLALRVQSRCKIICKTGELSFTGKPFSKPMLLVKGEGNTEVEVLLC